MKGPRPQIVTKAQRANNDVNKQPRTLALKVVDRLFAGNWQHVHKVIRSNADLWLVRGWHTHGGNPAMSGVAIGTLGLEPALLSPLGQLCQLALAMGYLGRSLEELNIPDPQLAQVEDPTTTPADLLKAR